MNRKRWIAVAAVLGVAASAAFAVALVPPKRHVYGVASAGPDAALMLTRTYDHTRSWVELVDAGGRLLWSAKVSPLEAFESYGHTGVAAADDQVIVVGTRPGEAGVSVLALDIEYGHRLWETSLPSTSEQREHGPTSPMVLDDSQRIYVMRQAPGGDMRVDTLDRANGGLLWSLSGIDGRPLDLSTEVDLLDEGRLLVTSLGVGKVMEIDGRTGEMVRQNEADEVLCQIDTAWALHTRGGGAALMPRGGGVLRPLLVEKPWSIPYTHVCGQRGEDLVVEVEEAPRTPGLASFDVISGEPRWRLALGGTMLSRDGVLQGPLPRFLPVVLNGMDETRRSELVIVDLDEGLVVSRTSVDAMAYPLTAAGRGYVVFPTERVLLALDPATGVPEQATAWRSAEFEIRAEDVRDGRLWITGPQSGRPRDLPWAMVDLATGRTLHESGGMTGVDVTAETLSALEAARVEPQSEDEDVDSHLGSLTNRAPRFLFEKDARWLIEHADVSTAPVVGKLEDAPSAERAAIVLGWIARPDTVPALVAAFNDPSTETAGWQAAVALAAIPGAEAEQALEAAAAGPDAHLASHAVDALAMRRPPACEAIAPALVRPEGTVRYHALRSGAEAECFDPPTIEGMLSDADPEVAALAARLSRP